MRRAQGRLTVTAILAVDSPRAFPGAGCTITAFPAMTSRKQPPILLVDSDEEQLSRAERALAGLGVGPVATLRDPGQVRSFLARNRCVLVMLDVARHGAHAAELVGRIVCEHPAVTVVATGGNDVAEAVA